MKIRVQLSTPFDLQLSFTFDLTMMTAKCMVKGLIRVKVTYVHVVQENYFVK